MIRMNASFTERVRAFMVFLAIIWTMLSTPARADECADWERRLSSLTAEEKEVYRRNGFVLSGEGLSVLISKTIIPDCGERSIAENYFNEKIRGAKGVRYDSKKFRDSKRSVARAACLALNVTEPWVDGVSHDIYNLADDVLRPYWETCIVSHLNSRKSIDVGLFTDGYFERPTKNMLAIINKRLMRTQSELDINVAIMLIVKKNAGEKVTLIDAKRLLDAAVPFHDENVEHRGDQEIMLDVLSKKPPVKRNDAYVMEGTITGSFQ